MMHALQVAALLLCPADAVPAAPPVPTAPMEDDSLRHLLTVRRVFVDRFTGGETAAQMRDMIIAAFQNSKLFVITENEAKADAILRGSGEDLVFTDVHTSSDSLNVHSSLGTSRGVDSGSLRGGAGTSDRSSENIGFGAGENESSHSTERRHEANATVRLVDKDGDVIWSTTQESLGGKFHGASVDVADKITKRLIEDYARAKRLK